MYTGHLKHLRIGSQLIARRERSYLVTLRGCQVRRLETLVRSSGSDGHNGESGVSPRFQELISTLRCGEEYNKIGDLLRRVYEELETVGDWKTGVTVYKMMKKRGVKLKCEHSSAISNSLLLAYFRSGRSAEKCWDFINRLSRLGLEVNEKLYIFAARVTIMISENPNLLETSFEMLSMLSHLPAARGPLILCLGKRANIPKALDIYDSTLKSFCNSLNFDDDVSTKLQKVIDTSVDNVGRTSLIHLLEHTLCITTELVRGSRDRLYSGFPAENLILQDHEHDITKRLILLSVKIIAKCSLKGSVAGKRSERGDPSNDTSHVHDTHGDACTFSAGFYESTPFVSTLELLKNTIISVFRVVMYKEGLHGLRKFRKTLEGSVKEHLADRVGDSNNVMCCMKVASAFCLSDYLNKVKNPEANEESLATFSEVNKCWREIIIENLQVLVNTHRYPASSRLLHSYLKDVVSKTHSNCSTVYRRLLLQAADVCLEVLRSRADEENFELKVNKRSVATVAISLLPYLMLSSTPSLSFAESILYIIFVESSPIDPEYFRALLRAHVISLETNFSYPSYEHSLHASSTILFRLRLNNYSIDTVMMTYILKILINRNPALVRGQSGSLYEGFKPHLMKIMSFLHLHVDALRGNIGEEFVAVIIESLLSNKLYNDFKFIYGRLKYNHNYRFSLNLLAEIVKGFSLSFPGSNYVTQEYRFELDRLLSETKRSWNEELVNAVLRCCITSKAATSAISFARSHIYLVSVENLRDLLALLKEYGSLCQGEQNLVTSWIKDKVNPGSGIHLSAQNASGVNEQGVR